MDKETVYRFIRQGEGLTVDFKFNISNSRKIARSIVAFANAKGGNLLIGVKDNGKIAGVEVEEEIFMLEDAFSNFVKPEVSYTISQVELEEKTILCVSIVEGKSKPYFAKDEDDKWLAYLRVADDNLLVNAIWIQVQKRLRSQHVSFTSLDQAEKDLLVFLNNKVKITLPEFRSVAKVNQRKATHYLVNLITLGIVEMHITKEEIYYTATQPTDVKSA